MSEIIECPVCGHEIPIKKEEKNDMTEEEYNNLPEYIEVKDEKKTYTVQDYNQTCNEIDRYFKEKEEK